MHYTVQVSRFAYIFVKLGSESSNVLSAGLNIRFMFRLQKSKNPRPSTKKECLEYDTKFHLMMRSKECGVALHCDCCCVYFNPKWNYYLGANHLVKFMFKNLLYLMRPCAKTLFSNSHHLSYVRVKIFNRLRWAFLTNWLNSYNSRTVLVTLLKSSKESRGRRLTSSSVAVNHSDRHAVFFMGITAQSLTWMLLNMSIIDLNWQRKCDHTQPRSLEMEPNEKNVVVISLREL